MMQLTLKQMAAMGLPPDQVELMRKAKADWQREQSLAKAKARAATGDERIAAIEEFLLMLSSEERPRELLKLIADDPPEMFWPVFLSEWSTCDAGWEYQKRLTRIFRRVGPCPVDVYARCNEAAFYAGLPEQLTVYRGSDRSRIERGISWTTDREVALGFAQGHRGIRPPAPVIATATIRKADIFAAINDRSEYEVICLPKIGKIEAIDFPIPA